MRQLLSRIYALSVSNFQASNCGCVKKMPNISYGSQTLKYFVWTYFISVEPIQVGKTYNDMWSNWLSVGKLSNGSTVSVFRYREGKGVWKPIFVAQTITKLCQWCTVTLSTPKNPLLIYWDPGSFVEFWEGGGGSPKSRLGQTPYFQRCLLCR